jgi:CRP-like cAMP-binding protein
MDIGKLFANAKERERYAAGDVIFSAGDEASLMYVVLEGEVEVRLGDQMLNQALPGDLLGEMALVSDHKRSATAVARTDCELAPVDERRFVFLVQQTPFFALHVMRVLAERLVRREREPA